MTDLLLNPTKADFSPEGLLPHEAAMQPRARIRTSLLASPPVLPARLKRLLDGWMAGTSDPLLARLECLARAAPSWRPQPQQQAPLPRSDR